MKIAYVAGPYRDKRGEWFVEQNIRKAEAVALKLWEMGFAVICPHKNTAFFGGSLPDETWLIGDLEILARCDIIVVLPGWEISKGAQREVQKAKELKIPVYSWDNPQHGEELANISHARSTNKDIETLPEQAGKKLG